MQVTVLVADDEQIAREAQQLFFSRNFPECKLYFAADGMEALRICKRQKIDLAIIDIEMPGLNGLELMENLRENGFAGQLLVVTAYSRFSYAQKVVEMGANAYILKPFQERRFYDQVSACIQQLNHANEIRDKNRRLHRRIIEATRHAEQSFWNGLNDGDAEALERLIADGTFGFDNVCGQMFYVHPGRAVPGAWPLARIEQVLRIKMGNCANLCFCSNSTDKLRLYLNGSGDEAGTIPYIPHRIIAIFKQYGYPDAQVRVREQLNDVVALLEAAEEEFFFSANGVCISYAIERNMLLPDKEATWKNMLMRAAMSGKNNRVVLQRLQENLEGAWEKHPDTAIVAVKQVLLEIALKLLDAVNLDANIEKLIVIATSPREPGDCVDKMLRVLSWHLEDTDKEYAAATISRAINYMYAHLGDPISLDNTAEYVGMSPYHFSRVFFSVTGSKYVNYLTNLRIDLAKRLIETLDLPLGELSRSCGYQSASYFCEVFKRYTGMKVGEYKEKIRKA